MSNQGDKTVAVVDTVSLAVVSSIPVGTNPHFLHPRPGRPCLGLQHGIERHLRQSIRCTQQVIASFQVGPSPQQIAFGFKGLLGPLAYVTVAGFNKVLVLDADRSACASSTRSRSATRRTESRAILRARDCSSCTSARTISV